MSYLGTKIRLFRRLCEFYNSWEWYGDVNDLSSKIKEEFNKQKKQRERVDRVPFTLDGGEDVDEFLSKFTEGCRLFRPTPLATHYHVEDICDRFNGYYLRLDEQPIDRGPGIHDLALRLGYRYHYCLIP